MVRKALPFGQAVPAVVLILVAVLLGVSTLLSAEPKRDEHKAARGTPAVIQPGPHVSPGTAEKVQEISHSRRVQAPGAGRAKAAIEAALAQTTQIEFTHNKLANVVDYLRDYHKIEIQLDNKALEDVGVATDAHITVNLKGISLRSALDLILTPLGLTWTIRDEVLLITTPEQRDDACFTVEVYDVADLVACRDEKGQPWDDYDTLVHVITAQIQPISWSEVGGPAAISAATLGSAKVMVVTHHSEVHRQIEDLLARIRAIGAKSPGDGKLPTRSRQTRTPPPPQTEQPKSNPGPVPAKT